MQRPIVLLTLKTVQNDRSMIQLKPLCYNRDPSASDNEHESKMRQRPIVLVTLKTVQNDRSVI